MAATDAAIVGRIVDGMLLVVQPDKNHRRLVLRAVESLLSVQVNLCGIVANRVGDEKEGGYYGYGSGYGYGYGYGYGAGYGQEDESASDGGKTPKILRHRAFAAAPPEDVTACPTVGTPSDRIDPFRRFR